MIIRLRIAFFLVLTVLLFWFLYIERAILTPFILAALFAYTVNPIVNFFSKTLRLPRTLAILVVYVSILGVIIFLGTSLTTKVISESTELKNLASNLIDTTKMEVNGLPDWARPTVQETLKSLEESRFFSPQSLFALFPEAISRIISFIIFLFSGFYFLKEGRNMFDRFLSFFSDDYKIEIEILARKINMALGSYLRGLVFMTILMSLLFFVSLSVLGIRFALIVGIFSGLAEIVPLIGPIVATTLALLAALITSNPSFFLTPAQTAIAIGIVYFVIRQIQDYFIAPYIMGKITKLHPFIIFFVVIAGGHLMGILGFVLAVPVAATIRILLEYSLDKIHEHSASHHSAKQKIS